MVDYIQVASAEGNECIELPTEEDKTILLSTVAAQFPGTCGLKFKTVSGRMRGIRVANGLLHPPTAEGWGDKIYYCVFGNDAASRFALNSNTLLSISSLSSHSIPERGTRMSEQNSVFSCQSFLSRIRERPEPNSSSTSSVFSSSLQRKDVSKNTTSSSTAEYDNKMKKISALILELKKAYKEKLIYSFITKSLEELTFEKPGVLPEHIVKHCETNILKAKIGYFSNPNEMCNRELFHVLFEASIEDGAESMSVKDIKILEANLFEHVSVKAEEVLRSIAEVDELGFVSFLKEGLFKPGSIFSDEQLYIISQSMKIRSAHDSCKKSSIQIIDILECLCNYRQYTFPDLNQDIIDSLKTKAEAVEKETRCFFAEVEQKIVECDENVIEAIKILHKHLKEVYEKKTYELAQLKARREEYKKVEGQRYNELVQEYKRLTQVLDRKMDLLEAYSNKDTSGNLSKSYIESDDD